MADDPNGYQVATDPDPYAQFLISQAIRVGNLVYLSGQASIDRDGAIVGVGDFDAQAQQTFANLKAVLEAAGSSLDNVVKVTIFLKDMANFPKILELRQRFSRSPIRPTRSSRSALSACRSWKSRSRRSDWWMESWSLPERRSLCARIN